MQQAIAAQTAEATEAKAKYLPLIDSLEKAQQESLKYKTEVAVWQQRFEAEEYALGEMRKRNAASSAIETQKNFEIGVLERKVSAFQVEIDDEKRRTEQAQAQFETVRSEKNRFELKLQDAEARLRKEESQVQDLKTEVARLRVFTNEDALLKKQLAAATAESIKHQNAVEEAKAQTAFMAASVEKIKDRAKQDQRENEIMRSELQSGTRPTTAVIIAVLSMVFDEKRHRVATMTWLCSFQAWISRRSSKKK